MIEHETLFRMKEELNLSGQKVLNIAQILGEHENLKIQEHFKAAIFEKNHELDEYFDSKTLDLLVNDYQDFQLWRQNQDGHIVDKVGHLPFQDRQFSLPISEPGYIQDTNSDEILSVHNNEVIFMKKVSRNTRSNLLSTKNNPKLWVIGPVDSKGFFRIIHSVSRKVLTSSSDGLKIEKLACMKDSKDKKLTKLPKTFVYCPNLKGFIEFVAHNREIEDNNIQADLSLDGGGNSFKIFTSVQSKNDEKSLVLKKS